MGYRWNSICSEKFCHRNHKKRTQFFHWSIHSTKITPETADGLTTKTNIVSAICMLLTYDINENNFYTTPGCVFDIEITSNILGISTLGKFFGENAYIHSLLAEDGTAIK